jgi:hypothetical protein
MKLSLSVLSGLAALGLSAQAATITVTNVNGTTPAPIVNSALSGGGLVGSGVFAIGTFSSDPAGVGADGIGAIFQQFGDAFGTTVAPGIYQNSVTSTVGGSSFADAKVYTVVGNGSTIAASSALAVWDHAFNFKSEPDATDNAILGGSGAAVLGNTVSADLGGGAVFDGLQLVDKVPEPSSSLLGLLGLSFLAFRRRK